MYHLDRKRYYCHLCKANHYFDSNIGKEHIKFKTTKQPSYKSFGLKSLLQLNYVLGVMKVGSSAIKGMTTNDLDVAIFIKSPYKTNIKKFCNSFPNKVQVLGKSEDGTPYIVHSDGIDYLMIPPLKGITPEYSKKEYSKHEISLEKALKYSPVARTPFHLKYMKSLNQQEIKNLVSLKKELKKVNLYRSGISSIQLATLVKGKKDIKKFILSDKFKDFVDKTRDPSDPHRYLWASINQRPYIYKLFKTFAKHDPKDYNELIKKRLEESPGKLLTFRKKTKLLKSEHSKTLAYAKKVCTEARRQKWKCEIIDSIYKNGTIQTSIVVNTKYRNIKDVPEQYRKYIKKHSIKGEKFRESTPLTILRKKLVEVWKI